MRRFSRSPASASARLALARRSRPGAALALEPRLRVARRARRSRGAGTRASTPDELRRRGSAPSSGRRRAARRRSARRLSCLDRTLAPVASRGRLAGRWLPARSRRSTSLLAGSRSQRARCRRGRRCATLVASRMLDRPAYSTARDLVALAGALTARWRRPACGAAVARRSTDAASAALADRTRRRPIASDVRRRRSRWRRRPWLAARRRRAAPACDSRHPDGRRLALAGR